MNLAWHAWVLCRRPRFSHSIGSGRSRVLPRPWCCGWLHGCPRRVKVPNQHGSRLHWNVGRRLQLRCRGVIMTSCYFAIKQKTNSIPAAGCDPRGILRGRFAECCRGRLTTNSRQRRVTRIATPILRTATDHWVVGLDTALARSNLSPSSRPASCSSRSRLSVSLRGLLTDDMACRSFDWRTSQRRTAKASTGSLRSTLTVRPCAPGPCTADRISARIYAPNSSYILQHSSMRPRLATEPMYGHRRSLVLRRPSPPPRTPRRSLALCILNSIALEPLVQRHWVYGSHSTSAGSLAGVTELTRRPLEDRPRLPGVQATGRQPAPRAAVAGWHGGQFNPAKLSRLSR